MFHVASFIVIIVALELLHSTAVMVSYSSKLPERTRKKCRGSFNNDIKPVWTISKYQYTRYTFTGNDSSIACCYAKIAPFDTSDKSNPKITAAGCCFPFNQVIPADAQLPCCSHGKRQMVKGKERCMKRSLKTTVKAVSEVSTACKGHNHESQVIQIDKHDPSFKLIQSFCCLKQEQQLLDVTKSYKCCAAGTPTETFKHVAGYDAQGCI